MNDDTESATLTDYAEELAREIRVHASALDASGDPRVVIAASNSLRAAARLYVQKVLAQTGWGNVFADLEHDETLDAAETASSAEEDVSALIPTISYRQQYRLRIHDFDAAIRLLESRGRIRKTSSCDDYDRSYTGLIAGLAELDGWEPYSYDQDVVEVLSVKWECDLESSDLP